jgi:hypothetical protein
MFPSVTSHPSLSTENLDDPASASDRGSLSGDHPIVHTAHFFCGARRRVLTGACGE